MGHFEKTAKRYRCECPKCGCPGAGGTGEFTFRYVNLPLVYFDVPKSASSSIRRSLFGEDESHSLRPMPLFAKDLFRFSFVRNPWARAVSNWRMYSTQANRRDQLTSMGGDPDFTFAEFLKFAQQKPNHHWLPQSLYVPKKLSFLGRLENFSDDLERVQTVAIEAGLIKELSPAPHLNSTNSRHYSDYYSDIERQLVDDMYSVDIERFEYKF